MSEILITLLVVCWVLILTCCLIVSIATLLWSYRRFSYRRGWRIEKRWQIFKSTDDHDPDSMWYTGESVLLRLNPELHERVHRPIYFRMFSDGSGGEEFEYTHDGVSQLPNLRKGIIIWLPEEES